jgi:hypothetical protein
MRVVGAYKGDDSEGKCSRQEKKCETDKSWEPDAAELDLEV